LEELNANPVKIENAGSLLEIHWYLFQIDGDIQKLQGLFFELMGAH
jgi:hypothetical protein